MRPRASLETSNSQENTKRKGNSKSKLSNGDSPSEKKSKAGSFSIPLRQRGGVFEVMATLNAELKVYFVVDSGASEVAISENIARLLADNESLTKGDFLERRNYQFANGATSSGSVVRIRTLDLNGHVLKNVRAVVLKGENVPLLLGQSALRQLGSWSINSKNSALEITP